MAPKPKKTKEIIIEINNLRRTNSISELQKIISKKHGRISKWLIESCIYDYLSFRIPSSWLEDKDERTRLEFKIRNSSIEEANDIIRNL